MTTFNHQQVKRFKPLPVGTLSSGREVLEIIRAADTRSALYRIRYGCCGHIGEIGHVALRIGVRRDKEQPDATPIPCRSCACVDAAERRSAPKVKPAPPLEGVHDLRGHFWPALGLLGPRFGSGQQKNVHRRRSQP